MRDIAMRYTQVPRLVWALTLLFIAAAVLFAVR